MIWHVKQHFYWKLFKNFFLQSEQKQGGRYLNQFSIKVDGMTELQRLDMI